MEIHVSKWGGRRGGRRTARAKLHPLHCSSIRFINVIPVYQMRGPRYLLGFFFTDLLSSFVPAHAATGARIVLAIVSGCLQLKTHPRSDLYLRLRTYCSGEERNE